jgi:hypothetical protein
MIRNEDRIYADQMFRELRQINSNPSVVSVECTTPDSAQWKIVREFTRARIAASSMLNIST